MVYSGLQCIYYHGQRAPRPDDPGATTGKKCRPLQIWPPKNEAVDPPMNFHFFNIVLS